MTKIYILTDLEGVAGIFAFSQTRLPEAIDEIASSRRLLTREVNACVDGILNCDQGATVVVWDGHGPGGIDATGLHKHAELIAGRGVTPPYGLDSSFDAVFFVGQHAMAGTRNAPLAHTMSSRTVESYTLNGKSIGEFGLRTYLAGHYGVPTALCTGDDKAVAEAQALVPNLVGVVTKVGLGLEAARSVSPARAQDLIRDGASEACKRVQAKQIQPGRIDPPFRFEVRVMQGQEEALASYLQQGMRQIDAQTAVLETADPLKVLR